MEEIPSVDLCDLFNKYGSDKDRNGYVQLYHTLFRTMRTEPIVMLEIGIGTMAPGAPSSMVGYALEGYKPGGSLRAWRDFFVNGRIIGADVQEDTQFSDESRIETYLCNSTKPEDAVAFMKKLNEGRETPLKFDIIIDDGSHIDMDQINTLRNFYPHVKDGGIYVIEDIYPGSKVSTCPALVGCMCNHDPYFFAGVKSNLCIIHKHHLNTRRQNY
ncbi:Methyltransferase [uncultured virus]|nr:Methyltransferase [uncultured virus]